MVERLLGVSLSGVPDDATDALALAIGCCYRAAVEPRLATAR
jgi:Holliday junction resolvasome RuvABC endonuclease subunit